MKPTEPVERVVTARGSMEVYLHANGVVVQRASGHASKPHAEAIVRGINRALAEHDAVRLYNDWYASTGYDSEVRKLLTEFTTVHREQLAEVHILTGSRLVAMGVAVAGIAVAGMRTYSAREEFERALAEALLVSPSPSSSSPSWRPRAGR